jgi:hypothetical protein
MILVLVNEFPAAFLAVLGRFAARLAAAEDVQ